MCYREVVRDSPCLVLGPERERRRKELLGVFCAWLLVMVAAVHRLDLDPLILFFVPPTVEENNR